jgi:hypothetical protein
MRLNPEESIVSSFLRASFANVIPRVYSEPELICLIILKLL